MYQSAFGVVHPETISKKKEKGEYKKLKQLGGKTVTEVRRGSAGRRFKTSLKESLPSTASAAAGLGAMSALKSKPNAALAAGGASLVATSVLANRGTQRATNKSLKNGDLKITNKKTGQRAKSVGWKGPKY